MSFMPEFSVSEFVDVFNQTLDYAYPSVVIYGELANFRIQKGRFVYFDLKDDMARLECYSTVYNLPGPLEDGMLVKLQGTPKLHSRYGFSFSVTIINPIGLGSIKKMSQLLAAKLEDEGLFSQNRKRSLPYPPTRIGLITSIGSAAYADFIKIINNRWVGLSIDCFNVSVQGDRAPVEIIRAINYFSSLSNPPEVLVIIRGGGSDEDLAAFNNEQVVRAVAASRVPTLIGIGHETNVSFSELAADLRASTPSNAAELLVPSKREINEYLVRLPRQMSLSIEHRIKLANGELRAVKANLETVSLSVLMREQQKLENRSKLIDALSPKKVLKRGYAIVRSNQQLTDGTNLAEGSKISIEFSKISLDAEVKGLING